MKKITFTLLLTLISYLGFSQGLPLQDFEGAWLPTGWEVYDVRGAAVTWQHNDPLDITQPAYAGSGAAYLDRENVATGTTEDWLRTPRFEVPQSPQLKFYSRLGFEGNQGSIYKVMMCTTGDPAVLANYTQVQQWTESQINPNNLQYREIVLSLPATAVPGQQIYLAFVMTGDADDKWLIDNVQVVQECLKPTTLAAANITQTGANLSWANPAGATSFDIEIVLRDSDPTGVGVSYNGTQPYPATELIPATCYKYYVRAACTTTNKSEWAGPYNFCTVVTGANCDAPIVITTPNFSVTSNTNLYGDDFDGAPGATGCNTTGSFLNGDEVVYQYNAAFNGVISINMSGTGPDAGLFVYSSCANIGTSCIAGGTGDAETAVNLPSISVTSGTSYYIVISTSGNTQSTPYTLNIQRVNCPPPTGLAATGTNATSANLTWNANGAASWQVVVQAAGAGLPAGAGTTTTTNTFVATQTTAGTALAPATAYEYYVRADCNDGTGNFSSWAGPFTFNTTQIPATLNYVQDFETTPSGFTLVNGTQPNTWVIGTAVDNGGDKSLYITNNGTANAYTTNESTRVHAYRDIQLPSGLNEISVAFDWKSAGEAGWDFLRVWVVPASYMPTAGTQIDGAADRIQVGGNFETNTTFTTSNNIVNVSQFAGQVVRLVFEWTNDTSGGVQPPVAVDNINVSAVTCSAPTAIAVTGITQTSATLSWTPPLGGVVGYDYYLSTTETAPTAATVPTRSVTAPTAPLTLLEDSTPYYFWVRTNCGTANGNSLWAGPFRFNTLCGAFDVTFTETFNSDSPSEFCWLVVNANNDEDSWDMNSQDNPFQGDQEAALYTDFNNGNDDDWLISPQINLNGNQRLRFRYRVRSEFEPNSFEVKLSTTGVDLASFTNVIVPVATYSNTGYVESTTNLLGYTGPVNIAWHVPQGGPDGWYLYIDSVIVENIPTCPDPTNLTVSNPTATGATLSWTAGLSETAWQVVIQPQGTGVPTAESTIRTAGPAATYPATGLEPSTFYEYYVRANCGVDDLSNWVGPFVFSTTQIPATLNFTENFETGVNGWTLSNGNQTNKWVVGTAVNNGGTSSLYISNDNGVSNAYSTSDASRVHAYRDILVPAGTTDVNLGFDWRNQGESNWDFVTVWVVPATFTPTPGTRITEDATRIQIGGNYQLNVTFTTVNSIFNAARFAGGTMRVIFEWNSDTSGGNMPPGAIDNVAITIITCPQPVALTASGISDNQATVSWTEQGTSSDWEVYVATAGSPAPTATSTGQTVADIPATITQTAAGVPLAGSTNYIYYVRAICNATDKSLWSGPFAFKTAIGNDDCGDAVVVTVNPTEACAVITPVAFTGSTVSAEANNCTGANSGDVWYEFVATNDAHGIKLLNFSGDTQPVALALYEGDQCGALTQLACSYNNVINASGLAVGSTYKIRVYLNIANATTNTSFDLCVNTPPPPANNNQSACVINTINPGFEDPAPVTFVYPPLLNHNIVPGWRTTAPDQMIEFWPSPNYENVPAYEGIQFVELNANVVSGLYQDFATPEITEFTYSFAHRGRQGTDTCQLFAGPPGGPYLPVGNPVATGNTAWSLNTGAYTSPAGQTTTRFIFQSVSSVGGASVGNFLDAITFTANNGIISANPANLDCANNVANIIAAGSGTWIAHTDNPTATVIADPNDNTTSISGFGQTGTYRYDWNTTYCISTLEIVFDGGSIVAPVATTAIEYCKNDVAAPLTATALAGHDLKWYTTATGGTALAAAPAPSTATAGDTVYYVSQALANGCESPRLAITVTVNELPVAPVASNFEECASFDATVIPLTATALPNHTLNWYTTATGGTPSASAPVPDRTVPSVTTYYVSQTSPAGCESARTAVTATINAPAVPDTNFTLPVNVCAGSTSVTPVASNNFATGGTYTATSGLSINAATGEINVANSVAGTYTVTYTVAADAERCIAAGTSSETFIINPDVEIAVEGDCDNNAFILTASPVEGSYDSATVTYQWSTLQGVSVGNNSENFNVSEYVNSTPQQETFPMQFIVKVINGDCESQEVYTVDDISCTIQKGISPNGDNKNDNFDLRSLNVGRLSIFNRYGQEVYSLRNYSNEWSGQTNGGDELPTGTYYYMIERKTGENKTGWIYINREEN